MRGKYDPKIHPDCARILCEEYGFRDVDVAQVFDINQRLLYVWKNKYPELKQAMEAGKAACDYEVIEAVKNEITGYYIEEQHVVDGKVMTIQKWHRGNASAGLKWLAARQKDWRETVEVEHELGTTNELGEFLKVAMEKMRDDAIEKRKGSATRTISGECREVTE